QFLVTCAVIALFVYCQPAKLFVRNNPVVLIVALVISLIVLLMIACFESFARKHPVNFICLGIFTLSMALFLGTISSFANPIMVIASVGVTALLVTALAVYAIQTKYDYTATGCVAIAIMIILMILLPTRIWGPSVFKNLLTGSLFALIACFFFIYDMQAIIGGSHSISFDPEDYVFAALTLYIDIIRIFLIIRRFLSYS
ncbi:hypothetical protein KR018_004300, partial [Drosophila ironensis]